MCPLATVAVDGSLLRQKLLHSVSSCAAVANLHCALPLCLILLCLLSSRLKGSVARWQERTTVAPENRNNALSAKYDAIQAVLMLTHLLPIQPCKLCNAGCSTESGVTCAFPEAAMAV